MPFDSVPSMLTGLSSIISLKPLNILTSAAANNDGRSMLFLDRSISSCKFPRGFAPTSIGTSIIVSWSRLKIWVCEKSFRSS